MVEASNHGEPWRYVDGLLSWGLEFPDQGVASPADFLHRSVHTVISLLGDFAMPMSVSWETSDGGQRAHVQRWDPEQWGSGNQLVVERVREAISASIALQLQVCYPVEPVAREISGGGSIYVEYDGLSGPEDQPIRGLYLSIAVNAEIYARRTMRADGDNRVLADLNAPRLNRFLRDVQQHFGQRFTFVDYEGDASQIDHNGFLGHDLPGSES